jgi:hypothetical protein
MCNRHAACLTLVALLLAVAACARSVQDRLVTHDDRPAGLLISNVHVFDASSGAFSEPAGILIRDGRIHAVGPSHELAKPEKEIDARGAFALPALWDSHVHLSVRTLEGSDAVRETLEGFVQAGVLYVRDVGGPLDVIAPMRDLVRAGDVVGPAVFFSGPLAERPPLLWGAHNQKLPGFTVPIESEAQVDSLVTSVARAGGAFVKTFGKWDVDLFRRLVRLAGEADLEVVVDPGAPFFQDIPIDVALAAGVSSIEHAHTAWQSALPAGLKAKHDSLATGTDPAARVAFINEVGPLGLDALDLDSLRTLADRMTAAGAYFCPTLQVPEAWRTAHPVASGLRPAESRSALERVRGRRDEDHAGLRRARGEAPDRTGRDGSGGDGPGDGAARGDRRPAGGRAPGGDGSSGAVAEAGSGDRKPGGRQTRRSRPRRRRSTP